MWRWSEFITNCMGHGWVVMAEWVGVLLQFRLQTPKGRLLGESVGETGKLSGFYHAHQVLCCLKYWNSYLGLCAWTCNWTWFSLWSQWLIHPCRMVITSRSLKALSRLIHPCWMGGGLIFLWTRFWLRNFSEPAGSEFIQTFTMI
jgi:hypothetical protein